jgi:hypothetical protein
MRIHLAAGLGREPEMAAPVVVSNFLCKRCVLILALEKNQGSYTQQRFYMQC